MSDMRIYWIWLRYSHNDLISARHLYNDLHPKQIEVACYLSQQGAEKAIKGYLFFKDIEPLRIHNLVELCQLCMQYDGAFESILDMCVELTPYGVAVRYPNELAVDENIAKRAVDTAQQVYDFCVSKIPEN